MNGTMTEFGAVHVDTDQVFHGALFQSAPDPKIPAIPVVGVRLCTDEMMATAFTAWLTRLCGANRPVFVSDNPAYDFMWIAGMFDSAGMPNPFGHSGRRLSDFWAGLNHDWTKTQGWKKYRITPHDHNPVNDSRGNVEAFKTLMQIAKEKREG